MGVYPPMAVFLYRYKTNQSGHGIENSMAAFIKRQGVLPCAVFLL